MRIDRSHSPWIVAVACASGLAALCYTANLTPGFLPFGLTFPAFLGSVPPARATFGSTPLGLLFGGVAFLIFLVAAALGVRKKKKLWPMGHVQIWMKAHLWLTVFTIPLIFLHSGFRLGGPHTKFLLALYTVVMVSGIYGIVLQQFLPSLMRENLSREVVFEQIPFQRAQILEAATRLRDTIADASVLGAGNDASPRLLLRFMDEECLPYLAEKSSQSANFRNAQNAAEMFKLLKLNLHPEWRPRVAEIEAWCESRRLMDLQSKFQHWLHGWLLLHIPTSLALLVMTIWHAWMGVRFLVTQPL